MKSSKAKGAPQGGRRTTVVAALPQAVPRSFFWPAAIAIAAAFGAVFILYGPAMNGPFLLDDDYLPYRTPLYFNAPWNIWLIGNRPLLNLSFWLNFRLGGQDTFGYHLFNVLLHLLNGAWIYLALRKLLAWAGTANWSREVTAIFAAGLFLVHPIQTESVTYIASRSETLSVCFFLAAFVVFLFGRPAASFPRIAAVLALYGAAVLTKEHTAVLPALLLFTDYYWNPGFSLQGIRRQWKLYGSIAFLAAAGGAVIFRTVFRGATTAGFHVAGVTWFQYFFTQCRVIWEYIFAFLFPFWLNVDADVPISQNIVDHGAIIGLIGLLAVSAAAWIYRRRFPLASYGWFVFLLLLAPTSSIVPIVDPYAERRLYLPFIGLLLIVAEFVPRWKAGRGTIVAVLSAVLLCEAGLTIQRNALWSDAAALWKDTTEKSPRKVRPSFQLAFAYYLAGRCGESAKEFSRAASLDKPTYDLLLDWGVAYDCAGDHEQALAKLQQSAALQSSAHVYAEIGKSYAQLGKYKEALDSLSLAERLDPSFAMTYAHRGNILLLQGDKAAAANEFRRALALEPENSEATAGLTAASQ
jgi:protein O-mannosyl-transferase